MENRKRKAEQAMSNEDGPDADNQPKSSAVEEGNGVSSMTPQGPSTRSSSNVSAEPVKAAATATDTAAEGIKQPETSGPQRGPELYAANPLFLVDLLHVNAEALQTENNQVFVATRTDKITEVFKGLVRHNFLSVPIMQKKKGRYYGFIDMADIVRYIVQHFKGYNPDDTQILWELLEKKEEFQQKTVRDIMTYPLATRNPFHPIKSKYSLLHAMELLAKEPALHRVPVVDENMQLKTIITQSHLVKFLHDNLGLLGEKQNKPVCLCIGVIHAIHSVKDSQIALDAFNLMTEKQISGVAVVDGDGKFIGSLSVRDLKGIAGNATFFWRLYQTSRKFLEMLEAPDLVENKASITPSQSLGDVIRICAFRRLHRLFILNDSSIPVGVISLKDVLREIIS